MRTLSHLRKVDQKEKRKHVFLSSTGNTLLHFKRSIEQQQMLPTNISICCKVWEAQIIQVHADLYKYAWCELCVCVCVCVCACVRFCFPHKKCGCCHCPKECGCCHCQPRPRPAQQLHPNWITALRLRLPRANTVTIQQNALSAWICEISFSEHQPSPTSSLDNDCHWARCWWPHHIQTHAQKKYGCCHCQPRPRSTLRITKPSASHTKAHILQLPIHNQEMLVCLGNLRIFDLCKW